MKITKIQIRPAEATVNVHYLDDGDMKRHLTFSSANNADIAAIVSSCESVIPSEDENPARSEVEQEISEIEYRLEQLRKSIGVTD